MPCRVVAYFGTDNRQLSVLGLSAANRFYLKLVRCRQDLARIVENFHISFTMHAAIRHYSSLLVIVVNWPRKILVQRVFVCSSAGVVPAALRQAYNPTVRHAPLAISVRGSLSETITDLLAIVIIRSFVHLALSQTQASFRHHQPVNAMPTTSGRLAGCSRSQRPQPS